MPQDTVLSPANRPGKLFQSYQVLANHYDELFSRPAEPRAHWDYFIRSLDALGAEELQQRCQEAHRQILENGVSYNVYGDPQGSSRPWELDPIPVLIDSKEWLSIEAALMQRAELLNLILKDIYGPRELIRKKLVPQEVIFKHEGFARACSGVPLPEHALTMYAADLVRASDGVMQVISDRTQAPSGAGYALENRMVTARVLPSLFRDSQVHRLALFFRTLRMTLARIAPPGIDEPNIVILSPGPLNETFFEHAYLANYLGYPLVQGSDLTVRKNHVWLRSLDGLQRVDVIIRRLDDHWSDPLEFRAESQIGVAGLLEAARCGNVVIANPLGSSVLENPALMPFLPAIAKYFLGAELLISSAETWWCGDSGQMNHVVANLDSMVVKPISPYAVGAKIYFPSQLSMDEKQRMTEEIKQDPDLFVAQQQVELSTMPAFQQGALHPRQGVLRSFAVARDDAYIVMPGGLTRIAPQSGQLLISNQVGGISKDTWVLASEPEKQVSLWQYSETAADVDNLQGSLPSRIAENLFWLGRYAERSEGLIRLLRKLLVKWIESDHYEASPDHDHHRGMLRVLHGILKTELGSPAEIESRLLALIQESGDSNGLMYNLSAMVQAAYSVRERLSSDTWYIINTIQNELADVQGKAYAQSSDSLEELDALISALMAFSGLTMESLSRGQDWLFLDLGRRVERAQNLLGLLRTYLVQPVSEVTETTVLEILLSGSESLMTFRRRYRSRLHVNGVLDLLILDERHPRSVAYQLAQIQRHIDNLPSQTDKRYLSKEEKTILQASTRLRLAETGVFSQISENSGQRDALDGFLSELNQYLLEISNIISDHFFTHIQPARQLAPLRPEARQ